MFNVENVHILPILLCPNAQWPFPVARLMTLAPRKIKQTRIRSRAWSPSSRPGHVVLHPSTWSATASRTVPSTPTMRPKTVSVVMLRTKIPMPAKQTVSVNMFTLVTLLPHTDSNSNVFFLVFAVTSQLLTNIITQLMTTTNSVMQLHQRLKNTEETSSTPDNRNQEMLKELESAVMMTQSMLTNITSNRWIERHTRLPSLQLTKTLRMLVPTIPVRIPHRRRHCKKMVITHRWWTNAQISSRKSKSTFSITTITCEPRLNCMGEPRYSPDPPLLS